MDSVRPLLLTASDSGGAGTAARRIHEGLREVGIDSQLLVREKSSDDPTIRGPESKTAKVLAKLRPYLDSAPLVPYDAASEYSVGWLPDRIDAHVERIDPDIVHLNWIAGGYMSPGSINAFDRPIVWRLPDMWPLTGGCHYAGDCTRYRSTCGECPQLDSTSTWDPSRVMLERKRRAVDRADVTVVATTPWLAEHARESTVFEKSPIEVIPNGLDTQTFRPIDRRIGRELFTLPEEVPLVLFGSVGPLSNPRKGYDLLREALEQLDSQVDKSPELVVFGTSEPEKPPEFDFPIHYTGYLHDDQSLAVLYATADVMVVPSRHEAFGQTVTESMACGTPVVAFKGTGPSDIIDHKETGYLATEDDPVNLATGISWLLTDEKRREMIGSQARQRAVDRYHLTKIAEQYHELYDSLL
ncbi:glycosyltransferase family 4 protein [Halorhabdus sp. BNX81]|uniref:glycosyltransferase family 4 protein n=1 Tax=Halorhabdus sp. BNX81 TaxID=2980181 RepID=UPI0023DD3E29|nr:glycosyltransferase family 4 protein [Halorhabdus sp. BNX81]WEL20538.1 Glycosyl transferase family 1 [Halorhabdus sp. BNX81]